MQKRRPTRRTATIERPPAQPQRRRQPNIKPGGVNFAPIGDAAMNQMYAAMSPQSPQTSTPLYPPGAPLRPVPGITPQEGPRVFTYTTGYNIAQLPRSTEAYSFADLRALASTYYGIQMCQQVWFDYISKLELVIEPRPDLIGEDNDISQYEDAIQFYQDFFAYPDKELDLKAWMRKAVKDQLEIDALSIFVRKDKAGRPYSLDIIDGAMIKPLIDDRGRRPQPPYPAYEQFWNGVPACLLTSDDLIYVKETERADSVYGLPRVEKIILNVNIALRKQTKDLARFTDGTLPAGFIKPEMDVQWTQEEIEAFEIQLNNFLAGNDEMRARIKVLPRGFDFQPTDDEDIHVDLDTHLLNITASMHGLTMAELAFVADVNRSSGETQENVVYRRAMGPLMNRYAEIFTMILRKYFKETRFVVRWKGFEEHEDFQMQASAYSTLTGAGILSPSRAAHLMHLPVDVDLPSPIIVTKSGPILLEDFANPKLRQAQMDAQLAGFSLAKQGTAGQGNEIEEEDEDEEEKTPPPPQQKQPAKQKGDEESPATKRLIAQLEELIARLSPTPANSAHADIATLRQQGVERVTWQSNCTCPTCKQNNGLTRTLGDPFPSGHTLPPCHEGCDCGATYERSQEQQTGMMLAFLLDNATAQQLAIPGGEPSDNLHITLAYFGDMEDKPEDTLKRPHTSPEEIKREIARYASEAAPLSGKIGGLGRFTTQPDGSTPTPVIATVDVPGLVELRTALVRRIKQAGYFIADEHGYTPHITLAYIPQDAPMPIKSVPALPLTLDTLWLCIGDERIPFKLGDEQYPVYWEEKERTAKAALDRELHTEYRRWKDRAVEDVKRGREWRGFTTTIIPEEIHQAITSELAECSTTDEVRSVFERAKERDIRPKPLASTASGLPSGGNQLRSKSDWKPKW